MEIVKTILRGIWVFAKIIAFVLVVGIVLYGPLAIAVYTAHLWYLLAYIPHALVAFYYLGRR